ncbi:hypothetical protein QBC42DRAFT_263059 [Cladorrhinum samala]|uniref:BTB domain-containing protein n=1 Tax=Cladorrhinum samala TaxID=585594 RepID=A0AAV9HWH3_9PEZI|nr:hypothetical protein QBC42DRAFT_263059 [Cladorrhinum samala]
MSTQEIDPSGDAIITLRSSKAPFAVWEPRPAIKDLSADDPCGGSIEKTENKKMHEKELLLTTPEVDPDAGTVRFLVSSRHLTLASPMIKAMLSNSSGWSEAQKDGAGLYQIEAEGWDETAFTIVLDVLHCRYRKVPQTVELEMLAKIAVVVDYYQVHEAMVLASRTWLGSLKAAELQPTNLNRELCLWLTVASVFTEAEMFKSLTRVAMMQSWAGMKFPADLPIPSGVSSRIQTLRLYCVKLISRVLRGLSEDYVEGRRGCTFECTAMHLGVLTLKMGQLKIGNSIFMGLATLEELTNGLKEMKSPDWYDWRGNSHSCRAKTGSTASVANKVLDDLGYPVDGTLDTLATQLARSVTDMTGLELSDFVKARPGKETLLERLSRFDISGRPRMATMYDR